MIIADAEGKEEDLLTPKTIRNHFDSLRKAQRAAGKPNTTAIQGFIQFWMTLPKKKSLQRTWIGQRRRRGGGERGLEQEGGEEEAGGRKNRSSVPAKCTKRHTYLTAWTTPSVSVMTRPATPSIVRVLGGWRIEGESGTGVCLLFALWNEMDEWRSKVWCVAVHTLSLLNPKP
jgi:hypothetical protein